MDTQRFKTVETVLKLNKSYNGRTEIVLKKDANLDDKNEQN